MNPEATDITLVLDRSGSMAAIRDDMEGALRTFVEDQVRLPGTCLHGVLPVDTWNRTGNRRPGRSLLAGWRICCLMA